MVCIDPEDVTSHQGSTVKGRVLKCLGSNPVTNLEIEEINKLNLCNLDINSEATERAVKKKRLQIEIKEVPEGLSPEMCTLVLVFIRRFQYATCLTGLVTSCVGTAL
jgi:hypothetical protein